MSHSSSASAQASAGVCSGRPKMRSADTRGMPERSAPTMAARAPPESCRRPRNFRRASSSDCTPIESRLTPTSSSARARSSSSDVGLHSTVTSRSSVHPEARPDPGEHAPELAGAQRLGVPPPKNTRLDAPARDRPERALELAQHGVGVVRVVDAVGPLVA